MQAATWPIKWNPPAATTVPEPYTAAAPGCFATPPQQQAPPPQHQAATLMPMTPTPRSAPRPAAVPGPTPPTMLQGLVPSRPLPMAVDVSIRCTLWGRDLPPLWCSSTVDTARAPLADAPQPAAPAIAPARTPPSARSPPHSAPHASTPPASAPPASAPPASAPPASAPPASAPPASAPPASAPPASAPPASAPGALALDSPGFARLLGIRIPWIPHNIK